MRPKHLKWKVERSAIADRIFFISYVSIVFCLLRGCKWTKRWSKTGLGVPLAETSIESFENFYGLSIVDEFSDFVVREAWMDRHVHLAEVMDIIRTGAETPHHLNHVGPNAFLEPVENFFFASDLRVVEIDNKRRVSNFENLLRILKFDLIIAVIRSGRVFIIAILVV